MKNFYNLLLTSVVGLKLHIWESKSMKDKLYYGFILVFRAVLVVCFCVLFIGISNALVGAENSPMAVVMVVMILIIRSVHFGYCIRDTLVTFALIMLVLLFAPAVVLYLPVWAHIFVHLIAMSCLILITCQEPKYGYGGFFGFAYVYLIGNSINVTAVEGTVLINRIWLVLVCYILCSAILIHKHHAKDRSVRFISLLKNFSFKNPLTIWQIRLIVGVSLVLVVGVLFGVKRFMWMGFACSTVLAPYPYSEDTHVRGLERIEGVLMGCIGYYILFLFIPESCVTMVGLLSGVALGLCVQYRWKTVVICFGALSIAYDFYGIGVSSALRVTDHLMGAVFGMIFAELFHFLIAKRLLKDDKMGEKNAA